MTDNTSVILYCLCCDWDESHEPTWSGKLECQTCGHTQETEPSTRLLPYSPETWNRDFDAESIRTTTERLPR